MLVQHKNHTGSFSIYKKFKAVNCLVTDRHWGDLTINNQKQWKSRQVLLAKLGLDVTNLVLMKQVHSAKVGYVNNRNAGTIMADYDGLVTAVPNLYLGVKTADCLPIFFYSPSHKIVAVAHAGWKGLLGNISGKILTLMRKFGADISQVKVAIGPHIGACCYQVEKKRVDKFKRTFPEFKNVAYKYQGQFHLDLASVNKQLLIKMGIKAENIDMPIVCTSCQKDKYFSFRRDSKRTYGEMLGIIGVQN